MAILGPWPRALPPLLAGTIMFAVVLARPSILGDDDTLWHILTGEWILHHWAVPRTDIYSYTKFGQRWFAQEWLSEVLLALANGAAGLRGVMVLAAAAMGLTAGLLLHHLRRFMAMSAAAVLTVLAMFCTTPSMLARPHALAWPVLELWTAGLVIARASNAGPPWLLLPLMVVWVNLHGGFIVGLALSGALTLEAAWAARPHWHRMALAWGGFTLAAVGATLLNPNGLEGLRFPFYLLNLHGLNFIEEWQPTNFIKYQPLEFVLLFGLVLGLLGRLKIPQFRLLLFLGLIHEALTHVRHNQILGIVGSLLLADAIGRMAPVVVRPAIQTERSRRVAAWAQSGLAACVAVALTMRLAVPLERERADFGLNAVLQKIPAALRAEPVMNEYAFGAKLILAGIRPYIDSRADLYGDAFIDQYYEAISQPDIIVPKIFEEWHVAWTIFPAEMPIVLWLDHQAGWHRFLTDKLAVVHVRDGAASERAVAGASRPVSSP
jgi:hypothetical protein